MATSGTLEGPSREKRDNLHAVLLAVAEDGRELCNASPRLKGSMQVVTVAVQQNGIALRFTSPDLRANWQLVFAAVKQNGLALYFASPKLKKDLPVVFAAVAQNGSALKFASQKLREGDLKAYVNWRLSISVPKSSFITFLMGQIKRTNKAVDDTCVLSTIRQTAGTKQINRRIYEYANVTTDNEWKSCITVLSRC